MRDYDPPYCKQCKRKNLTKEKCDRCSARYEAEYTTRTVGGQKIVVKR